MNWRLETDEGERARVMLPRHLPLWDLYRIHGAAKCTCRACGFDAGWADRLTMDEHGKRCPGGRQLVMFD